MFKNWNKEDERCPYCGQVTKRLRGITKQNVKRLFSLRLNSLGWFLIIYFILLVFIAWVYKLETAECREFTKKIKEDISLQKFIENLNYSNISLPEIKIQNEKEKG
jgi:hypothetical protein